MRLPYLPEPIPTKDAVEAAIVERIKMRREPQPLTELDCAMLHSPLVADGYNSFLGSIRQRTNLSTDIRELAICRVAVLNKAHYEWIHHAPLAAGAGVNLAGLKQNGEGLTEKQLTVLRYTDAITKDIFVEEHTFQSLKQHFTNKDVVEITATIAAYNCVSRFLLALDVGERNSDTEIEKW